MLTWAATNLTDKRDKWGPRNSLRSKKGNHAVGFPHK